MKVTAKGKRPLDLDELAFKQAELYALIENDEIDHGKAKLLNETAKNLFRYGASKLSQLQAAGVKNIDSLILGPGQTRTIEIPEKKAS